MAVVVQVAGVTLQQEVGRPVERRRVPRSGEPPRLVAKSPPLAHVAILADPNGRLLRTTNERPGGGRGAPCQPVLGKDYGPVAAAIVTVEVYVPAYALPGIATLIVGVMSNRPSPVFAAELKNLLAVLPIVIG